ncbi:hypothetical protein RD792_005947 [Penstemon davidsonii]|uniref:Fungal lipase-type domain-containing protein n=1 Tax=Penstemon davidsonii TaxID=160366 RepID=A0ABR0DW88_9LAMI|nr:hypothetical protein RD792_005947 [Penstemon davidsonii]
MNSTTFIPTRQCSFTQDHLTFSKPNDSFSNLSSQNSVKINAKSPSIHTTSKSRLADIWREIHGLNNWENLVEPLDPLLRQEIIRYGEFVTACYKAFDLEPNSKRYLNCKYGKKSMFKEVGMADSGYKVTKYIYATAPDVSINLMQTGLGCCGRWVGYVAVAEDKETKRLGRRDIVITFRGTVTSPEWIANLMSSLTPARLDPNDPRPDVKVEAGFLSLYTSNENSTKFGLESCREQLLSEVSRLLKMYKSDEISITLAGHSMGSSLALLLAYDIAELGLNKDFYKGSCREIPIAVFSFGGPRVGNLGFKERCQELGVKVLRIVNVNDPITRLPGVFFNENFRVFQGRYDQFDKLRACSCYAHVGVELLIDFFKMHNPSCVHDLESYIGLLKSCPKSLKKVKRGEGIGRLMERAKGFVLGGAQSFDALQWRNAALNMVYLVQSQWI